MISKKEERLLISEIKYLKEDIDSCEVIPFKPLWNGIHTVEKPKFHLQTHIRNIEQLTNDLLKSPTKAEVCETLSKWSGLEVKYECSNMSSTCITQYFYAKKKDDYVYFCGYGPDGFIFYDNRYPLNIADMLVKFFYKGLEE